MKVSPLFLLEFLLFNGGALVWAAWEYWQIRPGKKDKASAPEAGGSADDAGHPEG